MSDPVKLSVRSELGKIIKELETLQAKSEDVTDTLKETGKGLDKSLNDGTKKVENKLSTLRSLSRRIADQLKGDFKSLMSINALGDAIKISNQFRGSIRETVNLSDAIRKLGGTFGIAAKDFVSFQSKMVKGLGTIGLSSEVASRTLQGLAETPVRGQNQIMGYAQQSGMLASVSREEGSEGDIAKGMAKVIQARGGDVNDLKQVATLAEDLRRVFNQTGKGPTETLKAMEQMFANMPKDLRQSISSSGLTNLAAASAIGGPNATKFLEEYLGKSPIARMAFEAQGGKGIFTNKGIDADKFKSFASSIMGRVGGDPRLAAQTLGLSEDAAEGFVRLAENLDKVTDAQDKISKSTGSLNEQYRKSMGLGEAFKSNINRIKGMISGPLSWATQKGTDLLSKASESDLGAGGVVAGGGLLAALLAGGGIRGIGKGMIGGLAKGAAAEALTGKEVQPVYVVNASEIGNLGAGVGAAAGMGKYAKAGIVGGLAVAGGAAIAGLSESNPVTDANKELKFIDEKLGTGAGDAYIALTNAMANLNNTLLGTNYGGVQREQKVKVELNKKDLKESKQPTRGSSF